MRFEAKVEIVQGDVLPIELDKLAAMIVQVYKSISDYRDGKYPNYAFDPQRKIYPMVVTLEDRGGSGNSDSVVSGSLASPTPGRGGNREERGDEEDETESRGDGYGASGVGGGQRRQDAGGIGRAVPNPPHADHRMETAIAGAGR